MIMVSKPEIASVVSNTVTNVATNVAPSLRTMEDVQPEMAACHNNDENQLGYSVDEGNMNRYEAEEGSAFLGTFAAWYLPLIFLWIRTFVFGSVNVIRSIMVGVCLRLFLAGDAPKWAALDPSLPPAFTILAILTIVAFVIHPDGLTWFMLGKLRYVSLLLPVFDGTLVLFMCITHVMPCSLLMFSDAILSILHSFVSCWTMFIHDYGIVTTTIALMTLAGIGCLLAILISNARPKPSRLRVQPEKKKKKRKGVKGKGGRIRQFRTSKPIPENEPQVLIDDDSNKGGEDMLCSQRDLPFESSKEEERRSQLLSPASTMEEAVYEERGMMEDLDRPKGHSISVVETLADDVSCDSMSVRSFASAPTAVTVGSTGTERSISNRRERKSIRRKQQNEKGTISTRAQRKDSADKKLRQCTKGAGRHHEGPRQTTYESRPSVPSTGRFANLKEKDTRFDQPLKSSNRVALGGKGGRLGRGNRQSTSIPGSQLALHKQSPPPGRSHGPLCVTPATQAHDNTEEHHVAPYSYSVEVSNQKKRELVSLLSEVGMVDDDATSLVANVADVPSLERLSEVQFQLYGVSLDKQAHLANLLDDRQHGVRPPPGLSPIAHDEPPTLFPITQTAPIFHTAPIFQPFAYDEMQQQGVIDDEESRIEAELQELGGKMIGSILDF